MTSAERCKCPSLAYELPGDKRLAAYKGNHQIVLRWLHGRFFGFLARGDVNARTIIGETLLSAACAGGHHLLVGELLKCENVHLNTKTAEGLTPLMIASKNGHIHCVRLLLSTEVKCKLGLCGRSDDGDTALSLAAKNAHWNVVFIILDFLQYIDRDLPEVALLYAAKQKQWDIFKTMCRKITKLTPNNWLGIANEPLSKKDWEGLCVVLKCCDSTFVARETLVRVFESSDWDGLSCVLTNHDFNDQVFNDVLKSLIAKNCWDEVKFILEKYNYDLQCLRYNLAETARKKQWPGVEIFLQKVNKAAVLDVYLIERIIQESEEQIRELLHTGDYDYGVLNGALLVSACRGAEEKIIHLLFEHFHGYDYETLENLLFIGVLKKLLKALSPLLHHHLHAFTYDTLCEAQNLAKQLSYKDVVKILAVAIDEHTKSLCTSYSIHGEGRGVAQGAGTHISSVNQQRQHGPLQLLIRRAPRQTPPEDDVYSITSTPRGLVLIMNYQKFQDRTDLQRDGSQFDVINLMNLFSQMGYETQVHWDLTEDQTMHTVTCFRDQSRLQEVGCAIVFIMSHGVARQTFHTSDLQCLTVNKIQDMFLDGECPYLKGKPKLFFYNFCRGVDDPQMTVQSDAVRETPKDMICIYSAPEGFRSYRYAEAGTPFIISLCQVLSTDACDHSLDDLLRKFKKVYSSSGHGTTPDIQDLNFAKKFYFNPRQ